MWDENGFFDLKDTSWIIDISGDTTGFFVFPGRLIMYATNFPISEGGEEQSPPAVRYVSHSNDAIITGKTELWAQDTSGSDIIDYMTFSYYMTGQTPTEIGTDHDGFSPLRNNLDPAFPGDGYSVVWDATGLAAGFYNLEVTAFDTLGRSSTDKLLRIVLEPTRPTPNLTSPANGSYFCNTFNFFISPGSDDITSVQFFEQPALSRSRRPLQLVQAFVPERLR